MTRTMSSAAGTTLPASHDSTPGMLVASSIPGVNEALRIGHEAYAAVTLAEDVRAEQARRLTRPLPPEGTRERQWAVQNRNSFTTRCDEVEARAREACDRYRTAVTRLAGTLPATSQHILAAVEHAVWDKATPWPPAQEGDSR